MILGSHNTMTYLPLKYWWQYPFRFMAQCQNKTIQEQYITGARWFDLRLAFDKNGNVEFAHGLMTFKGSLDSVLDYLNSVDDKVIVRLLNERDKNHDLFIQKCSEIEQKYKNIVFIGGQNKSDWRALYAFSGRSDKPIIDKYASSNWDTKYQTGWIIDDLFPRLYAMCLNKHWRKKFATENKYLLQDFVGTY